MSAPVTADDSIPPDPADSMSGLQCALCALSFFRNRHRWATRRPSRLKRNRRPYKDWTLYAGYRDSCRRWIRAARRHGWRGSIVAAVMAQSGN